MMMNDLKRILLKLSGEALAGDKDFGFDEATCLKVAEQVKQITDKGTQVAIVIGPVKKFIDFQRNLHGHSLSVIIDGNFHLPFLHSDFLGKSEWGGGERLRG